MAALGLNHYNLRSSREMMQVLCNFYCDYLGLAIGPRPSLGSFGYWLYARDQAVLHLSETRTGEVRQSALQTSFDHVAFTCTDIPAMLTRLKQDGIPYRQAEVPAGQGFSRQYQVFFRDPAGNGIELNFSE
ncbi:VOC family protein [Undibacterium sp. SXout7W]|uniref:VOC family protein n=1 Tax=Undibacterium sp. SXout7W TaxID=3413049 RepID=UPI003BF44C66